MISFTALTQLFDLYELAYQTYRYHDGLLAIDTGFRYVDDKPTEELAVRVHFQGRNPAEIGKPVGGEAIQLFFSAKKKVIAEAKRDWKKYHPIIRPGISIGSDANNEYGSFGLIGYDKGNKNLAMLTCRHLFAKSRDPYPEVFQPAPVHFYASERSKIGYVKRVLKNSDVALVHLYKFRKYQNVLFSNEREKYTITHLRKVQLGEELIKSGATTGVTRARVDGIGLFFPPQSKGRNSWRVFRLVPVTEASDGQSEISTGGDSGAIWMDPTSGAGVGLHVAGEADPFPINEFAFALHLEEACAEIGFELKR